MNHDRRCILITVLVLVAACGSDDSPDAPPAPPCPEPDIPAPELVLTDLDGRTHALADLRCEAVVLLDFWATWCGPCRAGLPLLQELHDAYADQGLVVLAVNLGEDEKMVRNFLAAEGYSFTVLLDPEGQADDMYHIGAIPRQTIIDASGEIRCDQIGLHAINAIGHHTLIPALLAELDAD